MASFKRFRASSSMTGEITLRGRVLPIGGLKEKLIAKDVLQHWSQETIRTFLPLLPRYRFTLITNCVNPQGDTENQNIRDGEFRCLDLRRPPFNLVAREVFSFTNYRPVWRRLFEKPRWRKKVLLLDRRNDYR